MYKSPVPTPKSPVPPSSQPKWLFLYISVYKCPVPSPVPNLNAKQLILGANDSFWWAQVTWGPNGQHQARDSFFPPKNSEQMLLRKYFRPCCGLRFWAKMVFSVKVWSLPWCPPKKGVLFPCHRFSSEIHAFLACFLLYVPSCVSQERSWRRQRTWSNSRGRLDSSRKTKQILEAFWKKEVFFLHLIPTWTLNSIVLITRSHQVRSPIQMSARSTRA